MKNSVADVEAPHKPPIDGGCPKPERSAADMAYAGIIDLILMRGLQPGERSSVYLLAVDLIVDGLVVVTHPQRWGVNERATKKAISINDALALHWQ